jgi:dynein heavy chain 1
MVWFSEDVLSTEMIFNNYLAKLKQLPLEGEDESFTGGRGGEGGAVEEISPTLQARTPSLLNTQDCIILHSPGPERGCWDHPAILLSGRARGQMSGVLRHAGTHHGLHPTPCSRLALLDAQSDGSEHPAVQPPACRLPHAVRPGEGEDGPDCTAMFQVEQYVPKSLVYSILWSFAGDAKMKVCWVSVPCVGCQFRVLGVSPVC